MTAAHRGGDDAQVPTATRTGRPGTESQAPSPVPVVLAAAPLLALFGALYYAVESFHDQNPTLDLIAAVLLAVLAVTLIWVVFYVLQSSNFQR